MTRSKETFDRIFLQGDLWSAPVFVLDTIKNVLKVPGDAISPNVRTFLRVAATHESPSFWVIASPKTTTKTQLKLLFLKQKTSLARKMTAPLEDLHKKGL